MKNFSAMVYMADHSENLEHSLYHNCNLFTWDMTKIPFFAFFRQSYIKHNPRKIKVLEAHKNAPFINESYSYRAEDQLE